MVGTFNDGDATRSTRMAITEQTSAPLAPGAAGLVA
jgi:hypothetical protein